MRPVDAPATPSAPGSADASAISATLWLGPAHLPLVSQVVARGGWRVAGVGCPEPGRAAELAAALGGPTAENAGDLRAALAAAGPGLFLIAEPGDFAAGGSSAWAAETETLLAARERGVKVVSLEPIPASLMELGGSIASATQPLVMLGEPGAGGAPGETALRAQAELVMPCPLSRFTRHMQEAMELVEDFGPIRSAAVHCLGGPGEGSLGARLFDALDLVLAFLGEPESIDAAYTAPGLGLTGPGLRPLPRESLRHLHGDLTANLRLTGGRSATVLVSDQAGRYERVLTLVGEKGRVRVYTDGFEWIDVTGAKLDESRTRRGRKSSRSGEASGAQRPPADESPAAAPMAEQIARYLQSGVSLAPAVDFPRILAMAQATLLSTRTGEGESPATMMRMAGG